MPLPPSSKSLLLPWSAVGAALLAVAPLLAVPPPLPIDGSQGEWDSLYERVDSALQTRLETRLRRNPLWADLIDRRRLAVGVVDLTRPDSALFARVNGRVEMYAASLPKIGILLAAFQTIEDGTLEMSPRLAKDMSDMIRKSNNRAATRVYNQVGFEKIRSVLTEPRYGLFDPEKGGGIWVGKPYSKKGERHGDPLKNLSHAANVTQVCRFYYLLATGRLVSPERSRQMLEIMADPGVHHKFVHSLDRRAPKARLFRKSGTWKNWHSDSVLIWGPEWRRYVLVALVDDKRGEKILRELVPAVEEILEH